ncbi:hypothetical protein E4U39_006508 [Claviceps sp. Clav50 group G5]|nr:hypothetical protein E4U39_006508 [Claviceps sp. Clav50 group G5]
MHLAWLKIDASDSLETPVAAADGSDRQQAKMKVPLRRTVLDWASALEKGVAFFLQAPTGCGCTGNLMQKLLQAALNTEIQQTEVNGQEAGY